MLNNYIDNINSFENFYDITKPLTAKQKGDLFEELTKYIFKYHPNYQNFTKDVWLLNEVPLDILSNLNIPRKDQGIDLVLLDKHDQFHAIQCKFRTNVNEIIPWAELATFYGLAFGISKEFKGGFYVTNTIELTHLVHKSNQVIPLYGEFFNDIPNDFFHSIKIYFKFIH
jgi:predicted helicase